MEKPFWPNTSSFAPKTQRNDHHNLEQEIQQEEDNDVSTELTISCKFQSKKVRRSEASSSKSSPTENEPFVPFFSAIDSEREVFCSKKNQSQDEVSTELTLFDESWITKNRNLMENSAYNFSTSISSSKKPLSKDALEAELKLKQEVVASKIATMKYYSSREEEEERRLGVSTELKLYEDPFKIKKVLTGSDLGLLCRLLVKTSSVKEHILPYWSINRVNEIKSTEGVRVMVWDQDTKSVHQLIFKRWPASKSFVFIKWSQNFVVRRDLKEGDEVGLFWDPYCSRFNFSVLKRAP